MKDLKNLTISITNFCPNRCKGCFVNSMNDRTHYISLDEFEKLFKEARELGCENLTITGGEPMAEWDWLVQIVRKAKQADIHNFSLLTSGLGVPEHIDDLAFMGFTYIQISLHGLKDYHDWYMGIPGSWERAVKAIDVVCDNDIRCRTNCVITRHNIKQIPSYLKFLLQKRSEIRLTGIVPLGRADTYKELVPTLGDWLFYHGVIEKMKIDYPELADPKRTRIESGYLIPDDKPMKCDVIDWKECRFGENAEVDYKGYFKLCAYVQHPVGNIKERSLIDMWKNPGDCGGLFKVKPINKECGSCLFRGLCVMNCRAYAYMKYGDYNLEKVPYDCPKKDFVNSSGDAKGAST